MERFLGGEDGRPRPARAGPRARRGPRLVPPGAAGRLLDARSAPTELLDLIVSGFPSPAEHPMPEVFTPEGKPGPAISCDPDGPLVAEVVKTTSDAYVGRVSLVRVFSGTIRPDATVHVSGHFSSFFGDADEADRPPGRARGPRRGRADRLAVGAAGQEPPARRHGGRRRRLRDRPAQPRRDRRHPLRQGHPAGAPAVGHARAAAAAGDPGPGEGRRGQARHRAAAARRGGPHAAHRAQRRRPTRSCCGAWARRTPTSCSTGSRTGTAPPWTRSSCGCRCARRSRPRARPRAGT